MTLINKEFANKVFYTAEGNLKFNSKGLADHSLSASYELKIAKTMRGFSVKKDTVKSKPKTNKPITSIAPANSNIIQ